MKKQFSLVLFFLCTCSLALNAQSDDKPKVSKLLFSPKGVAEVRITLANGKKIGDIKNEKNDADYAGKLDGSMRIVNSSTSTYSDTTLYNGRIKIEGRGNTTWGVPKRPYNIDLVTASGDEVHSDLLDMPASDEWCLLAFWHDRSLMRIPLAFYLGRQMDGIDWSPLTRYVELYINDEYRGLYLLSEKIRRDDYRVDIKKLDTIATDQVEPRISGGYILEGTTDGKLNDREKAVYWKTAGYDIGFTFKYPKPQNVTLQQRNWIKNYLNTFEDVLRGNNYKDTLTGYQKYISVSSFIDWTILHEQSRGVDNLFHASTFVHKDREKKLNMSAPWDFDLSYANGGDKTETGHWIRRHRWFARLSDDPAYLDRYINRLDTLTPLFRKIPKILRLNYKMLEESGVLEREMNKWPQILTGYSPEDGYAQPYEYKAHVRYLTDWIGSRDAWCTVNIGRTDEEKGLRMQQAKPAIRVMDFEAMEAGDDFNVKVLEGYTYYWNDSETGVSSNTRKISHDGKYWVRIKDSWGNLSLESDTLYVGVPAPEDEDEYIEEEEQSLAPATINHLLSYSNPVTDVIDFSYYAPRNYNLQIFVRDMSGKAVLQRRVEVVSGNNYITIPTTGINKGVYILQLAAENKEIIARKLIVR